MTTLLFARPDYETIPGLDGETNTDDELCVNPEALDIFRQPRDTPYNTTTQVPRLLSKSETLRLLHVYQEAIGEMHPIVDTECLIEQVEILYAVRDIEPSSRRSNVSQKDDDDIHTLNIVCSIALTADYWEIHSRASIVSECTGQDPDEDDISGD